ncbi:hypothetical protein BN1326_30079 [Staphylococcus argenteus]|uniref:Uncharacterized protein n=1 Tax=Staphylococcus argenteus TaxID=985002 RepID=A0A7U7PX29_9STAP|nr:hypothetical protein BN1326_30079 [Staphylococcus argenteus]CRI20403.1 hypothetical protein BN1326_30079 [Staphylococcus argenteus]
MTNFIYKILYVVKTNAYTYKHNDGGHHDLIYITYLFLYPIDQLKDFN